MAFGFLPKYVQKFELIDVEQMHFMVVAKEAATQLNWDVSFGSESGFVAYTKSSWSSWSEEISVKIDDQGNVTVKSECLSNQLYDWGKNKKNVAALLLKIKSVGADLSPEELESKLNALEATLAIDIAEGSNKQPASNKDKITGFISIFKPTQGYFVTPILLMVNILVFLAMLFSGVHYLQPEHQDLLDWGANFRPLTLEGAWWRLFTACFLHIGIFHLLLNLYALLYIGLMLEPHLGKARFLAAYLIAGIIASLASLGWNDLTISAGASGAIFGMYGVFIALLSTNLIDKSVRRALGTSIAVFVIYNLMNGLNPKNNIDNAAHIGGLLSGLLIGFAFMPSLKQFENKRLKFLTIVALTVLMGLSSFVTYKVLPRDIGRYMQEMERFISMESMAMTVFSMPEGTTDEEYLKELRDRGIYYWKENLKLLNALKALDLPLPIRARIGLLITYCELRVKSFELMCKAIEENSTDYQEEIDEYDEQILDIIATLGGE